MNLRVRRVTGVSTSAILSNCRDDEISREWWTGKGAIDKKDKKTKTEEIPQEICPSTPREAKSIADFWWSSDSLVRPGPCVALGQILNPPPSIGEVWRTKQVSGDQLCKCTFYHNL